MAFGDGSRAATSLCALLVIASGAQAQDWTLAELTEYVRPLQHSLNGRMPLLAMALPEMPHTDDALTKRNSGILRANIDALWSRGIAPSVYLDDVSLSGTNLRGAIATGLTLQEAGVPVHIFAAPPAWKANYTLTANGGFRHYPWDYWPQGDAYWFTFNVHYAGELWPVFPLASPTVGYDGLRQLLEDLHAGDATAGLPGVSTVAGMWMDYEEYPVPWNGAQLSQRNGTMNGTGAPVSSYYDSTTVEFPGDGKSLRTVYGSDVLTNMPKFQQYSYDLRRWLLDQSARRALTDVYGGSAWFGNYGEFLASAALPHVDANDHMLALDLPMLGGTAPMPDLYANNVYLASRLGGSGQQPVNQTSADDVYWFVLLRQYSTSAQNSGATSRHVPWVSQYVRDDTSGLFDYAMSVDLYEELLRHIWLRGAMGMYVFNPYNASAVPAARYSTADYAISQLEYARGVLDEMLCFRAFLEHGTPMNFAYNALFNHGPIWSGLSYDGRAVVRTVSPNGTAPGNVASITVPGGGTFFNLAAPADGATWLLGPGYEQHRVDPRPATLYLPFAQSYADASGNGNNGVPRADPAGQPEPTFSSDVPGQQIRLGSHALYANRANERSLRVTRNDSSPSGGSGVAVANVDGAFNTTSFTVEAFVKVDAGVSQDGASLLAKGGGAGNADWVLRYREAWGAGTLELSLIHDGATQAYIRTAGAPLTPGVWHHLALTYDGDIRQVTVYVDYEPQPWGVHNEHITVEGFLTWDFVRHTDDQLVIGQFEQGIDARFDEVRFTPEALDPYQFLKAGSLD